MAKKKTTHAVFVLDRSGSMSGLEGATIEGFNSQLDTLAGASGNVFVSCVQFDAPAGPEVLYRRVAVAEAPRLTRETFVPRGATPMLDAVAVAIGIADEEAAETAVLVITVSDGMENTSCEETWESLAAKVKGRQGRGNWTFAYIGANQDLSEVSQRLYIPIGNTMTYAATAHGTRAAYTASAAASAAMASSQTLSSTNYFGKGERNSARQ